MGVELDILNVLVRFSGSCLVVYRFRYVVFFFFGLVIGLSPDRHQANNYTKFDLQQGIT